MIPNATHIIGMEISITANRVISPLPRLFSDEKICETFCTKIEDSWVVKNIFDE